MRDPLILEIIMAAGDAGGDFSFRERDIPVDAIGPDYLLQL